VGDLTTNFSTSEIACKCSSCRGKPLPSHIRDVVRELQRARNWSNKLIAMFDLQDQVEEVPYPVESGYRCPAHDKSIGGKGEHSLGAFDINYTGSLQLILILVGAFFAGCRRMGLEKSTVHLGFSPSSTHPAWRFWHYYSRYKKKGGR